jgi:putative ABC transport system ATP-binding protein
METTIRGENIVKSFGNGSEQRNVLDGASVEIKEGEFVAIMGPSGSGKSTLMYALSGMDRIDSGKVLFKGKDLSGLDDDTLSDIRRTRMGFVFQQPTLLKNLNILDNIILPSMRGNRKQTKQIVERARMLMSQTGIENLEDRDITQASGGQLQRVGICRALMKKPEVIFGDEPTGALDSTSANEIMTVFADIHRNGTTILLVTHDNKVAARAERVLFILDGKIAGEFCPGVFDEKKEDLNTRLEDLELWLRKMQL